jgi:hypothetical protein
MGRCITSVIDDSGETGRSEQEGMQLDSATDGAMVRVHKGVAVGFGATLWQRGVLQLHRSLSYANPGVLQTARIARSCSAMPLLRDFGQPRDGCLSTVYRASHRSLANKAQEFACREQH